MMEREFTKYLDTLELIAPSDKIMKKIKQDDNTNDKIKIIENKVIKLDNKKKTIRKELINDLLNISEYRVIVNDIEEQQLNLKKELSELNNSINNEDKLSYTYEEVKDIVGNIKLNYGYLTNKEKQLFLERFIDSIYVEKINNKLVIKSVNYKIYN
jgi:hypothetical protein